MVMPVSDSSVLMKILTGFIGDLACAALRSRLVGLERLLSIAAVGQLWFYIALCPMVCKPKGGFDKRIDIRQHRNVVGRVKR